MPTILITGATDGIGLELAKHYLATDSQVILHGRRPLSELDSSIFTEENYLQADLTALNIAELFDAWFEEHGVEKLDLLLQNAGAGWVGPLEEQPVEMLYRVNLLAPVLITRVLLSRLQKAQGKVVYISSIVTALPTPKFTVYSACKAALDGFARSLRVELASTGVGVQVLHPGPTRTGIHQKSGMSAEKAKKFIGPDVVAGQIVDAIQSDVRNSALSWKNVLIRAVGPILFPLRAPKRSLVKSVLITGGADGIGRALVERYAEAGCKVVWVDRDKERSSQLKEELSKRGLEVDYRCACLASNPTEWLAGLEAFDLLVHNAGISSVGRFEQLELDQQELVLQVNFLAPMLLTQEMMKRELLHSQSELVLLSSLSYFTSYPGASTYAGSKDGLAHFGRSLGWHRRVLTVFPGPTKTAHARRYSPDNSKESSRMEPERLARLIFDAQQAGRKSLLPDFKARTAAILGVMAPRLSEVLMRRLILEKLPQ